MKKSLVALAVLAATGAYAQSSVTMYGRLDLGTSGGTVDNTTAAGVKNSTKSTSLAGAQNQWTGSRIGLRGTEDLGGGLKANFVYEFRINQDGTAALDADTANFGRVRTSIIQLAGSFGTVSVGTYLNPFDDVRTSSASNSNGIAGGNNLDRINGGLVGLNSRSTNSIGYRSPVFAGGFTASFGTQYEKADTTPTSAAGGNSITKGYIASLGYANGPLSVLGVYGIGNSSSATATAGLPTVGVTDYRVNDFAVRASYNFGVAVPYLSYENTRVKNNLAVGVIAPTATSAGVAANGDTTSRGYELGSTFPMGAFTPYITYANIKQSPNVGNNIKTTSYQIGTKYDISKRTFAYVAIGQEKDKTDNSTLERKANGYGAGLVHQF